MLVMITSSVYRHGPRMKLNYLAFVRWKWWGWYTKQRQQVFTSFSTDFHGVLEVSASCSHDLSSDLFLGALVFIVFSSFIFRSPMLTIINHSINLNNHC